MPWQEGPEDPEGQGDAGPRVTGLDYAEPQPARSWVPLGQDYARAAGGWVAGGAVGAAGTG